MPVFDYKGKTQAGAPVEGSLEAVSRAAATVALRKKDLWIESLGERGDPPAESNSQTGKAGAGPAHWSLWYGLAPISPGGMGNFFEQLSGLYRAGVSMQTIVGDVSTRVSSGRLRRALTQMSPRIEAGESFADCLASHPQEFPAGVVGMVGVGELTGNLDEVAKILASDYQGEQRVWWLLAIPKLYFLSVLMLVVLIPSFPRFVIGAPNVIDGLKLWGGYVIGHILPWMFVALLAGVVYRIVWNLPAVLRWRDIPAYYLPVWGALTKRVGMCRFHRCLAIAVRAGVEFPVALAASAQAAGNAIMVRQLLQAEDRLRQGVPLHEALRDCSLINPETVGVLSSASQGGTFDDSLPRMADQAQTKRDNFVRAVRIGALIFIYGFTTLLVIVAAGFGYLAIYRSLFQKAGVGDLF